MGGGQTTARRPMAMARAMATARTVVAAQAVAAARVAVDAQAVVAARAVPAVRAVARRAGARSASDLVTREIAIGPGGSTGWHYHAVPLMAVVRSGTLTRILSDGTVEVHHAGSSFVEPAGIHHVHLGRNLGAKPVVLLVTAAIAEGAPFALPAEAPAHASDESAYFPADAVETA
ncbi:hypothetical protein SAVIM338S_01986 [Streptomyces avidinii]